MLGSGNPIETISSRSVTDCHRKLPPSQRLSLGTHWIVRRAFTMPGLSRLKYWSPLKGSVTSSARPESPYGYLAPFMIAYTSSRMSASAAIELTLRQGNEGLVT